MSLPCLWQLGGGVLVASHNEFDDLSDLDETHATGRVPLTRVVAGRLHAARGRPAEEQWAWRRRGGKKAGKKDERGHPVCPTSDGVSRSRCCEYPAEQKSIGRHCLAVGQTMPPSAKMSQSLMTRPVAAPGIHETGIQSDFASRWTGHGRRAPFFFLLVMVDGDLTHLAGSAGVRARPRHTAGTGVPLGDRSTEDSGVAGQVTPKP